MMVTQTLMSFIHLPNSSLGSHAFTGSRTRLRRVYTLPPGGQFRHNRCYPRRSAPRKIRTPVVAHVAIVGAVPDSFRNAILAPGFQPSDISLQAARSQHKSYCSALSRTSVTLLHQLPADPRYPDSVFVEDPLVVISEKTAFMGKAGHAAREGERDALQYHLEQLGLQVYKDLDVRLDGGDVLQMNNFILVGITERTEAAAIPVLQRVVEKDFQQNSLFRTCPCVLGVPVEQGLHLKSVVTWVGRFGQDSDGFLVAPDAKPGRDLIDRIATRTEQDFEVVWIDEQEAHAANVLYIPPLLSRTSDGVGHVLVQETCPRAANMIRKRLERCDSDLAKTVVVPVDTSEFWKANGALTCMSVIV